MKVNVFSIYLSIYLSLCLSFFVASLIVTRYTTHDTTRRTTVASLCIRDRHLCSSTLYRLTHLAFQRCSYFSFSFFSRLFCWRSFRRFSGERKILSFIPPSYSTEIRRGFYTAEEFAAGLAIEFTTALQLHRGNFDGGKESRRGRFLFPLCFSMFQLSQLRKIAKITHGHSPCRVFSISHSIEPLCHLPATLVAD